MVREIHNRSRSAGGFTFIEVVVVIIILGALATIAVSGLESTLEVSRQEEAMRELNALARGIVGDAALTDGAARGDFGFVGDVGALPNSLADLTSAPAGYSVWNGPYVRDDFVENIGGAESDPWGAAYGYSGGVEIQSTGSGSTITKRFANTTADLTATTVRGVIVDRSGAPPGADRMSIAVRITYPDGAGSVTSATVAPSASGLFTVSGIPIGRHLVEAVYTPTLDTALTFVTVRPRVGGFVEQLRFGSDYWGGVSGGGGGASEILRPDGPGGGASLLSGGCAANWECVDEVSADDSTTYVAGLGSSWNSDSYSLENTSVGSGTIDSVVVFVRCWGGASSQNARTVLVVSGTPFEGGQINPTSMWTDYSTVYPQNPATALAWSWAEINSFEAGVKIKKAARCTQVWVAVHYTP